jgi:hypothetical protein
MDHTCPKCGSKKIVPDLPLVLEVVTSGEHGLETGGGTADVRVCGNPKAWVFKDTVAGGLTVRVCGECGHAELHANNSRVLYEKYEKSRQL